MECPSCHSNLVQVRELSVKEASAYGVLNTSLVSTKYECMKCRRWNIYCGSGIYTVWDDR